MSSTLKRGARSLSAYFAQESSGTRVRGNRALMQEADVGRVDVALERLHPVALALEDADAASRPRASMLPSRSGSGGRSSRPRAHIHPDDAASLRAGRQSRLTLDLKSDSAGSFGMSMQRPSTSNFQPWYTQRRPLSSLRPKKSDAPRCGQLLWISPTLPVGVAEGDELFAEQHDAPRVTVGPAARSTGGPAASTGA